MTRKRRASRTKAAVLGSVTAVLIAAAAMLAFVGWRQYKAAAAHDVPVLTKEMIREVNVRNADKLMIVAHPDDETLWGGGHLMDGGYLVVCITGGRNEVRSEEFSRAVAASGNTPLILEYPDKVNGERDDWEKVMGGIRSDIDLLVSYKSWKQIVTHNPDGEYGHQHHRMTSMCVTATCERFGCTDVLMYMGKYYTKSKIGAAESSLERLSDSRIDFKNYILTFYPSQEEVRRKFEHMIPYENWQPAVRDDG